MTKRNHLMINWYLIMLWFARRNCDFHREILLNSITHPTFATRQV